MRSSADTVPGAATATLAAASPWAKVARRSVIDDKFASAEATTGRAAAVARAAAAAALEEEEWKGEVKVEEEKAKEEEEEEEGAGGVASSLRTGESHSLASTDADTTAACV